jgi:hypothetical protein
MSREVRRVPLDFDWPLEQVWQGYLMPDRLREPNCKVCERPSPYSSFLGGEAHSDGLSPAARAISETFYPHQVGGDRERAEQLAWHDKIGQAEVVNLVAHHRLHQFDLWDRIELPEPYEINEDGHPIRFKWVRNDKPTPTAEEVNAQQHMGALSGHDGCNRHILVRFRCQVLGISMECVACGGRGSMEAYPGQRAEAEAWESTDPPSGDGWQLWETVSEGSPVSPVFPTAEELAQWLTTPEGGAAAGPSRQPMTIDQARGFVGVGWAPSGVGNAGGFHDGASYVGSEAVLRAYEEPDND